MRQGPDGGLCADRSHKLAVIEAKGYEFATITPERLLEVEKEINNRPRNILAYQSPNDLLDHLRAS